MNRSTVAKLLAVAASAAILAALAGAVAVLGSPTEQRQRALDARRLSDLHDIAEDIRSHVKEKDPLPQELLVLKENRGWRDYWSGDPDTREPYEYKVLDDQSFQLCAVFALPSSDLDEKRPYYRYRNYMERSHPAGKHCFTFTRKSNTIGCGQ
jgi:hypothetical protein